jgi:hypothetical protein
LNAAELIIDSRKTNEIAILSGYVQRMGAMACSRVAWLEFDTPPEDCDCPSCAARECLATIALIFEVYHASFERTGCLDIRSIGQA